MRIGNFEGTPEEIKDLFENQNFKFEDYLGEPISTFKNRWLVIPIILFILFLILTVFLDNVNINFTKILFLFTLISGVWLTASVHIKCKNKGVTFIIALGLLIITFLGNGYMLPKEILDWLKKFND